MNNEQRRIWVLNDEGLYNMWRKSHKPILKFISENRQLIDEVINNITCGEKKSHYLIYG